MKLTGVSTLKEIIQLVSSLAVAQPRSQSPHCLPRKLAVGTNQVADNTFWLPTTVNEKGTKTLFCLWGYTQARSRLAMHRPYALTEHCQIIVIKSSPGSSYDYGQMKHIMPPCVAVLHNELWRNQCGNNSWWVQRTKITKDTIVFTDMQKQTDHYHWRWRLLAAKREREDGLYKSIPCVFNAVLCFIFKVLVS